MTKSKKKAKKPRAAAKPRPSTLRRTPVSEIAPEEQIVGAVFLGKARSFDPRTGLAGLVLEAPLSVGDSIRVKGRATDLTQKVERLEVSGRPVPSAEPGEAAVLSLADPIVVGDALYKL